MTCLCSESVGVLFVAVYLIVTARGTSKENRIYFIPFNIIIYLFSPPDRSCTYGLRIRSSLLCLLSYRGIVFN